MSLKELQNKLDIQKWDLSEKENKDMCGAMPFCSDCDKTVEYPCANAMMKSSEKTTKKATKTVGKAEEKPKAKTAKKAAK